MRAPPRPWLPGLSVGAVCAALAFACISPADDPNSTVPDRCAQNAPLLTAQKTDILFVIDNSGSMAEEQAAVASELPLFIDELRSGGGAAHDFQVGVITTAVYLNPENGGYRDYPDQAGRLQAVPLTLADGGTAPGTEKVLHSEDPELLDKFRRLVSQGTAGSGQETPFEAVRLAVSAPLSTTAQDQGGNAGFLRDGARLLVVVVSDEDDCSETERPPDAVVGFQRDRDYCGEVASQLTSVESYASFFKSMLDSSGNPRHVMWAAIGPVSMSNKEAGPVIDNGTLRNIDCPTSYQPGYRQRAMAMQFDPTLANLQSICSSSYRDSLYSIAQIANAAQFLEVMNVPDPRLLKAEIRRADGSLQSPPCTVANGGVRYHPPGNGSAQLEFTPLCPRRGDDRSVTIKLICVG